MANSDFVKFLMTAGVYSTFEFPDDKTVLSALNVEFDSIFENHIEPTSFSFDLYCPHCEDDSVYYFYNYYVFDEYHINSYGRIVSYITVDDIKYPITSDGLRVLEQQSFSSSTLSDFGNVRCVIAKCSRDANHQTITFVQRFADSIVKIGQYPDAKFFRNTKNISKYKKYLGVYVEELRTALQLHNHNVGVGSYVYLRRVLEKLVFDKYDEHKEELNVSEDEFKSPRFCFEDKVKTLKKYLPKFMLDNVSVYSILSKGIHELDEGECNNYFEFLYASVTLILDEIILAKEKEFEQKRLTGIVANIKGTLSEK